MTQQIENLIISLKEKEIRLWVEAGELKFAAKSGEFTDNLKQQVVKFKPEIINFLSSVTNNAPEPLYISREQILFASKIQCQLWFLDKLSESNASVYNITGLINVAGNFDLEKLIEICERLPQQYEALRTIFEEKNGVIYQVIKPYELCPIMVHYPMNESEYNSLIKTQAHTVFKLANGPLFRCMVIKYLDKLTIAITLHHIIADGASLEVLFNGLINNYSTNNNNDNYTPVGLQYVDFVYWQRQVITPEVLQKQITFWRNQLSFDIPILEFPYDNPRPVVQSFSGANFKVRSSFSFAQLQKWGVVYKILTPLPLLLSVYAVLLHRYTNQDTIMIGIPISNRKHKSFLHTVGMFVNSLPVKITFKENMKFIELVQNVSQQVIEIQSNADITLDDLVHECLQGARNASHSPIFQTMFMLEEPNLYQQVDDVTFSMDNFDMEYSKFDLTLSVKLEESSLLINCEYNTHILRDTTIKRLINTFNYICEQVISDSYKYIYEYELLDQYERNELIYAWNNNIKLFNENIQLHELFEQQAHLNPEKVAVYDNNYRLTYATLNYQSNQLAHYLLDNGLKPNQTVGLMLRRNSDAIIAFLAVLKAGATFIPLDYDYPVTRINYSLTDAKAKCLITNMDISAKKINFLGKIFNLSKEKEILTDYSGENIPRLSNMRDLAYIIYTSGSTGKPKGVMIHHLGISHYIQWAIAFYRVVDGIGAPVHSSFAFDLTITSIFAPICCGCSVFMVADELGLEGLVSLLTKYKDFSLIKLTPAHLKILQNMLDVNVVSQMHASVVIGGEALHKEDITFWHKHGMKMRFINEYGATETSVADTIYEVPKNEPSLHTYSIPVGKAIDNSQMYVLDNKMRILPIGIIGEIYLSGVGLAAGYLNLPDKTAEKFLPHPFRNGEMIYKTGDLGRLLEDGNVEFMGRLDHQIKINGYRIELGEIENVLSMHGDIEDIAIKMWEDKERGNYIAVYIVTKSGDINKLEIRQFLQSQLPRYMLPSVIIGLTKIPLTINGKVDLDLLTKPHDSEFVIQGEYHASTNIKESIICDIWSKIFKLSQIGIYDNFFALGGDSIISIQFISKLHQAGWKMTTKQLFTYQTVQELAKRITPTEAKSIVQQDILYGECPLLPAQKWFLTHNFVNHNHFNMSCVLKCREKVIVFELERAIGEILVHHDALRLCYKDGIQYYLEKLEPIDKYLHLLDMPDTNLLEQMQWAETKCAYFQQQLDISKGKNLQCILFQNAKDGNDRIVVIVHHWVIDSVSMRVLVEDLNRTYKNLPLPLKTSSCREWVLNLDKESINNISNIERNYWYRVLCGSFYQFATVEPIPLNDYRECCIKLLPEMTSNILRKSSGGLTRQVILAVLLLALGRALKASLKSSTFLIEMEGHGRDEIVNQIDVSRTIGWFTNLYPFGLQLLDDTIGMQLAKILVDLNEIKNNGILFNNTAQHDIKLNQLTKYVNAKIGLNYLGQFNSNSDPEDIFELSEEDILSSLDISLQNNAWHLINVNAWIFNKELHLNISVHPQIMNLVTFNNCCKNIEIEFNCINNFLKNNKIIEIIPASVTQNFMWQKSISCTGSYITQITWHEFIENINIYKQAWHYVIQNTQSLRARFINFQEQFYQIIIDSPTYSWIDLAKEDDEMKNICLEYFTNIETSTEILMNFAYFKESPNEYHIFWKYHHAIVDGWSIPQLLKYVKIVYKSLYANIEIPVTPLTNLELYQQWASQYNYCDAEKFWDEHLSLKNTPLNQLQLLEVKNVNSIKTHKHMLSDQIYNKLNTAAVKYNTTLATLLQYAWGKVQAQITGNPDVIFATIVSGRYPDIPCVTSTIGMLMQIVPVHWNYANKDLTNVIYDFNLYLLKVQEYSLYDWTQNISYENLIALVVYENYLDSESVMQLNISSPSHFPLTVVGLPSKQALELVLEYDSEQFTTHAAQNILNKIEQELVLLI